MVVTNEMIEAFIENVKNGYADIGVVVDGEFSIDGIVNVREALTAALAVAPGVEVKPLEFKYHAIPPTGESLAQSVVGLYCIQHGWQNFRLRFRDSETLGDFKSADEAIAAAQADYTARIMSALATTETNGHE